MKNGGSRMKKLGKLVAIASALLMVASLSGCGAKSDPTKLRVGLECAYAPFNWTQSDDSNGAVAIEGGGYAGGYDIEIAKKIAAGMGRELIIVKTEWGGLEPAVNSGTIDAIIAGMSPMADRRLKMDFTDKYYTSDLVVVVKKDGLYANAKTLKDFANAKITGQQSTFHYTVIDQLEGVKKQTALTDFPTMMTALSAGTIDGYISERPGAKSALISNPDFTFISFENGQGFNVTPDDIAIAVGLKKGSTLTTEMNPIINGISEEERAQIMETAVQNQPMQTK